MASMVVGGLFNAIAFTGAGFLFSKLNKSGYREEVKRHNLAIEKLQQEKETFYQQETKKRDREIQLRAETADANKDISETNKAFNELKQLQLQSEEMPRLEDYYQPSDEMKKYQIIAAGIMGGGGGWLVSKLI